MAKTVIICSIILIVLESENPGYSFFIDNLCIGTYNLIATDCHNCVTSTIFELTEEPDILEATFSISNYNGFGISCNGGDDGESGGSDSDGGYIHAGVGGDTPPHKSPLKLPDPPTFGFEPTYHRPVQQHPVSRI